MADVKLSHPDKVLFPADGITKADLAAYYASVAEWMLPHVRDRPLNLWRWNAGIEGQRVVQQDIPKGAPDWVARVETPRRKGGSNCHMLCQDADTLRWLSNQNCITPHVWSARRDRLDRPDRIVFDLDPEEGSDFDLVRTAALAVGERLREAGLAPFAMTTGSKGVHVVAPLKRTRDSEWVRERARELGAEVGCLDVEPVHRQEVGPAVPGQSAADRTDLVQQGHSSLSSPALRTVGRPGCSGLLLPPQLCMAKRMSCGMSKLPSSLAMGATGRQLGSTLT